MGVTAVLPESEALDRGEVVPWLPDFELQIPGIIVSIRSFLFLLMG
jgi:hypothetical protein